MKTIFPALVIIAGVAGISADSCKSKKQSGSSGTASTTSATATSTAATTPTVVSTATVTPIPEEEKSRLIVSFYSIGSGIDGKVHEEFVKFLDSYPKKIMYKPKHWGREGEIDYCLTLKELLEIEQDEFVRKAKKILSTNVHFNENAVCQKSPSQEKCRLVISFYSIGEGINLDVQEKFEKFLSSYTPKIKHETYKWGREGEVDYCFKLTELSATQQEEFVMKSKEITTKKVHIKENEKCVH